MSDSDPYDRAAIFVGGHAPPLAHYPHARRVGRWLFVSGCSSRRPDGSHRGVVRRADGSTERDIREQTAGVLDNLRTVLAQCGVGLDAVVDLTTFLVRMEDYAGYNAVWNEAFEAQRAPARTTVAVAALPHPDLLIEIKATALLPPEP